MSREKLAGILVKVCALVAMGCGLALDIMVSHPSPTEIMGGLSGLGFITGVLSLARFKMARYRNEVGLTEGGQE